MSKQRVTITADREPLAAGQQAVLTGEYASLSEWANAAMIEKGLRDKRLRDLRALIDSYEAEHGVITDEETAAQLRTDRENAVVVRARRPTGRGKETGAA